MIAMDSWLRPPLLLFYGEQRPRAKSDLPHCAEAPVVPTIAIFLLHPRDPMAIATAPDQPRKRRPLLLALLAVLVVAAAGGAIWWFVWGKKTPPDMVAVLKANNRGVGFMEKFQYEEAVDAFEEVVKLAPDWLPGKINLGIALLNKGGEK